MIVDPTRQHIIRKMQSRIITKEEFDFDHLSTYPLYSLLSQYDVERLYNIASSIRYSGNISKKYKAMDEVLGTRGFVKLVAGTNRVAYRHLEIDNIVLKTAVDFVGIQDTPHEFENQKIFKPFTTKVFEASEDGTVGLFERVKGIVSREEFLSIASDVFAVISEWFVGEYVLADIGTKYFMNWGYRDNFGPVLLDFPYCYKLDGNKLFCCAPDENNPTGFCGGVIDYDDGYNYLHCKKCGVVYKAQELAEKIKTNNIQKIGGKRAMRIGIRRGDKVYYSSEDSKQVQEVEISEEPSIPVGRTTNNNRNNKNNPKDNNKVRKFSKEDILSMEFTKISDSINETLINRKTGVVIKLPDEIIQVLSDYKENVKKYNTLEEENEKLKNTINVLEQEKHKIEEKYNVVNEAQKKSEFFLKEQSRREKELESDIKHLESDNNKIQSMYEEERKRSNTLLERNEMLLQANTVAKINCLEDIANISEVIPEYYSGIVTIDGEVSTLSNLSHNLSLLNYDDNNDNCILLYNTTRDEYLVDEENRILALTTINGCKINDIGIINDNKEG